MIEVNIKSEKLDCAAKDILNKELKSFILHESNRKEAPELVQRKKSNRIAIISLFISVAALIVATIALCKDI